MQQLMQQQLDVQCATTSKKEKISRFYEIVITLDI